MLYDKFASCQWLHVIDWRFFTAFPVPLLIDEYLLCLRLRIASHSIKYEVQWLPSGVDEIWGLAEELNKKNVLCF